MYERKNQSQSNRQQTTQYKLLTLSRSFFNARKSPCDKNWSIKICKFSKQVFLCIDAKKRSHSELLGTIVDGRSVIMRTTFLNIDAWLATLITSAVDLRVAAASLPDNLPSGQGRRTNRTGTAWPARRRRRRSGTGVDGGSENLRNSRSRSSRAASVRIPSCTRGPRRHARAAGCVQPGTARYPVPGTGRARERRTRT